MSAKSNRALVTAAAAAIAAIVTSVLVLSAVGFYFVLFVPSQWNAYSFDSANIECVAVDATGETLLLVPIEQFEPMAHADEVRLLGATRVNLTGFDVLPRDQTEFSTGRQPTGVELEALRSNSETIQEGESLLGEPSILVVLVKPDSTFLYRGADGVQIGTITGEPEYWQTFTYRFDLTERGCAA